MRVKLYGLEGEAYLKDGSVVRLRPVNEKDYEGLKDLYLSLSTESLKMRFSYTPSEEEVCKIVESYLVCSEDEFGIVALLGDKIVGHAVYRKTSGDSAEVGFVVREEFQGRGLGTILLGALAEIAEKRGIKIFEADVRADNYAIIEVFKESGFPVEITPMEGKIRIRMSTSLTENVIEYFEKREKIATFNALKHFFNPESVAVIGASRDVEKVGGRTFYNLLTYRFNGVAYPVNRAAKAIMGVRAYPTISEVPDEVELAVLSVPVKYALEVAEECGKKGVKALLVLTAGFAEVGGEGVERQKKLVEICRKYGMRLIGPNCMGIINTAPETRLLATFAPTPPNEGSIAFASQSGAVGLALMDRVNNYGLGLSYFVSLGNSADITSNDLIEFWEEDGRTKLIMLYQESIPNPRKFARLAKRISKKKPILAIASGVTPAGAKAVASHTGAIVSSSGIAIDALFKQTGIIRASSIDELFSISEFLLHQPLPKGNRVCIVTNGGGLGAITSDWCHQVGLEIAELSERTQESLRNLLPEIASVKNPVDMTASADVRMYGQTLKTVAEDENVDAIICIFVAAVSEEKSEEVEKAVISAAKYANSVGKPVVYIYISSDSKDGVIGDEVKVPVYVFPNTAAKVLGKVVEYAKWREKSVEPVPTFEVDRARAASIIAEAIGRREWLSPPEAFELLRCFGISFPEYEYVKTPEEVYEAAKKFGRVALKAHAPNLIHKTEKGAVKVNLTPKEAKKEAEEMLKRIGEVEGFLVQRMSRGVEMFVGVAEDPSFGPLITCGAGGILVELMKDVSVRVTPITRQDAVEMVRELKAYKLLEGYRGGEKANVEAFIETILRINYLIEEFPEIVEMDCNPVMVSSSGAEVVDAKIRIRRNS
ncbi:acetate--CoA ligase alpha subunit [Archaeoglobus fulgidus]|uniref:acetate--CoA ligase alpha subunit n=1 Tax=Archaeoglobus fulgidus TaxID=2234 RepID=UPI000B36196A|nr:GNAT family N-acetyltransferase [Archaeoglobus fulgidus]